MYTSKLKLTLHWLLIVVAFYIIWALAYLVFVKFAMSEISNFSNASGSIWSVITAADIFWFVMFIFGIAVTCFLFKKAIQYSPHPKIAAAIYILLVVLSVGTLVLKLLETSTMIQILPHLVINGVFLIPMLSALFKKDKPLYADEEDDENEEFDND
jgi:hypothetical protein